MTPFASSPGSARGPSGNRRSYLNGEEMKTRYKNRIAIVLTLSWGLFLVSCTTTPSVREEEHRQWIRDENKREWDVRILEIFKVGRSEDEILQDMRDLYFGTGTYTLGGDGTYERIFIIDDYFEIAPLFDRHQHLITIPVVEPRSKWLRFPNGKWLRGPNLK